MDLRDVISNVSNDSKRVKSTSQQQMHSAKCTKAALSLSGLPSPGHTRWKFVYFGVSSPTPCFTESPSASQPWQNNGLRFLLGTAASKAAAPGARLGFQTVTVFNFEQISF